MSKAKIAAMSRDARLFAVKEVPYFRGELGGMWELAVGKAADAKFAELVAKDILKMLVKDGILGKDGTAYKKIVEKYC